MAPSLKRIVMTLGALAALTPTAAVAQQPQPGGTMRIYQRDNPASASIHEEATYSTNVPFMAVFNNLVIFDQHVPQNSEASIVPELAASGFDMSKTYCMRSG